MCFFDFGGFEGPGGVPMGPSRDFTQIAGVIASGSLTAVPFRATNPILLFFIDLGKKIARF